MSSKEYTREGIEKLYNLSVYRHRYKCNVEISHLFRNKDSSYFEEIFNSQSGIMQPYLKDLGNDPYNPTNLRLAGLFFTADGSYSEINQNPSFFGDTRFVIPITNVMNDSNLYFADFYCLQSEYHYVNLVLCKPFSNADDFCRERLYKISKEDNPFLKKNVNGKYEVIQYEFLNVEVFVTWPVDMWKEMNKGSYIYYGVGRRGMGSSKKGGLPKNRFCTLCNISNPTSYIKDRSSEEVIDLLQPLSSDNSSVSFNQSGRYGVKGEDKELVKFF